MQQHPDYLKTDHAQMQAQPLLSQPTTSQIRGRENRSADAAPINAPAATTH